MPSLINLKFGMWFWRRNKNVQHLQQDRQTDGLTDGPLLKLYLTLCSLRDVSDKLYTTDTS